MKRLFAIYLATITAAAYAKIPLQVDCHEAQDTAANVIYLHGLDPEPSSPQELANRVLMKKWAAKHHLTLLILRSPEVCKGGVACWPHEDATIHKTIYQDMITFSKQCFKKRLPLMLVGFSNGGYFASKVSTRCYDGTDVVIASGSAGSLHGIERDSGKKASACAPLYLIMGEQDLSAAKAKSFVKELTSSSYRVTPISFQGRHELSERSLDQAFTLWQSSKPSKPEGKP